jgi:hypothetical protein
MQKIPATSQPAQLRHRRMEVEMTLRHLEKEKRQVESNTEWLNYAAYKNRVSLLDRVVDWYRNEMKEIDRALDLSVKTNSLSTPLASNFPRWNDYQSREK